MNRVLDFDEIGHDIYKLAPGEVELALQNQPNFQHRGSMVFLIKLFRGRADIY